MSEAHDRAEAIPRVGWYGDDFTGATDTLAAFAESGLRTTLFLAVPDAAQLAAIGPLDAVGIAGAARTMSPAAMASELEPVGRFFAQLGVRVLHYKCCSTFDSAPQTGSIGAAIAVLRRHVDNPFVPILGGQPSIGRYCLFSNLFAAAGAGGGVDRLDRHPTMSRHPVTPMREADLRRHLAEQGLSPVLELHHPVFRQVAAAAEAVVDAKLAAQAAAVLIDLVDPEHLAMIGGLIWGRAQAQRLLAVGPSSVAQALTAHWASLGKGSCSGPAPLRPSTGAVLVLAGSLSPVTKRQVDAAQSYEQVAIDVTRLASDSAYVDALAAELVRHLKADRHVLASTHLGGGVPDTSLAGATAAATAELLRRVLHDTPVRRVGVAGGDTSSLAIQALGVWALSYHGSLAPGVTVCRTHSAASHLDGVELMLKGGQMGDEGLLERLITGTG